MPRAQLVAATELDAILDVTPGSATHSIRLLRTLPAADGTGAVLMTGTGSAGVNCDDTIWGAAGAASPNGAQSTNSVGAIEWSVGASDWPGNAVGVALVKNSDSSLDTWEPFGGAGHATAIGTILRYVASTLFIKKT